MNNSRGFTTAAPRLKKRGPWRSIENARAFMFELFKKKLRKCSYDTLVFEFITFFGSNDQRTVERYLGRAERTERDAAKTKVIRMNRTSGRIAQFEYYNERRLPAKKGLLDVLGWILKLKDGTVLINHEVMTYYTRQVKLEGAIRLQEHESCEASKAKMCVSSLLEVSTSNDIEAEETVVKKEKEEEVIDSTHTCKYGVNYASKHISYALTPELAVIANAEPLDAEPDRAKVAWPSRKESPSHV